MNVSRLSHKLTCLIYGKGNVRSGKGRILQSPTMLLYSVGLCKGASSVCEMDQPEQTGVRVGLESSKCVHSRKSWIYFY